MLNLKLGGGCEYDNNYLYRRLSSLRQLWFFTH
jgi:hypothetical protein